MMVLLILALVIVVGVVVAVVVGKVGTDSMPGPTRTSSFELPQRPLEAADLDGMRFDQAVRGYNMTQVDAVLDKLHDQLAALEGSGGRHSAPSTREPWATRSEPDKEPGSIVPFRSRRARRESGDDADDV